MIALPDFSTFAAVIADRRFAVAVGIAALSGLVRGFSGFGAALVYVPLMAALYDPRIASVTLLLTDFTSAAPFAIHAFPRCNWREVIPIVVAAAVGVPFGIMALVMIDPIMLRWIIAVLVVGLVVVLASGWRYHGRPALPLTIGVGLLSGLGAGAVQMGGPPVLIYWLGGQGNAAIIRANLMVYFVLLGAVICVAYLGINLFTADTIALWLLLTPPFILAMLVGARWFRGASDRLYRVVAYAIIAVSALLSVPIFDSWIR